MNRLLQALCQIRFSSRCLALDDEVAKSMKLQAHLQHHAAAVIAVGVKAWRAMHNVPAKEMKRDGGKRWRTAVWVVRTLQMSAVIGTQRITPESVVADSLNELQKLLDRGKDRELAKQLALENTDARQSRRAAEIMAGAKRQRSKKQRRQDANDQKRQLSNFSADGAYDKMLQSETLESIDKDTFTDTINWKERNAFMTRKAWHANTGNSARVDHGLTAFSSHDSQQSNSLDDEQETPL